MTPWASAVEDDLEFAEPGNFSSQAGQEKVSGGRENWGMLEVFFLNFSGTS